MLRILGLDRATIVRSMTHPYNIHSAAYALTGVPQVDIPMELNPYDSRHWPFIGSVLDYLEREKIAQKVPDTFFPTLRRMPTANLNLDKALSDCLAILNDRLTRDPHRDRRALLPDPKGT